MPKRARRCSKGVTKLARAVKATLGPRGRNAVIDKGWGAPTITKDGVTVAEEIELKDKYENIGAKLVKEAAQQDLRRRRRRHDDRDRAGRGDLQGRLPHADRRRRCDGAGPRHPQGRRCGRREPQEAVQADRRGKDDIANVASISANNDREIGKIMADAFEQGRQGRRDHRRGRQGPRDLRRRRRRHAVRPRLPLAQLHHQSGRDDRSSWRSRSSSSTRTRSAPRPSSSRCWRRSRRPRSRC